MRQLHFYSFEWPSFSLCVHPNGNSCTCSQCRQEQLVRIRTGIRTAEGYWLVRFKLMWSYRYDLVQPRMFAGYYDFSGHVALTPIRWGLRYKLARSAYAMPVRFPSATSRVF